MTIKWYDKEGKLLDSLKASRLLGDRSYKCVSRDELPDGTIVSTIWLGSNHQYGEGPPLIFETMVFPSDKDFGDLDCERYSTLEEAHKGHKQMVEKYSNIGGGEV